METVLHYNPRNRMPTEATEMRIETTVPAAVAALLAFVGLLIVLLNVSFITHAMLA